MKLQALILTVAATVPVVLANHVAIGAPQTIVPDQPFELNGEYALDKRGVPMIMMMGVLPFNRTSNPNWVPSLDYEALGYRINDSGPNRWSDTVYYRTYPNVVVPKDLLYGEDAFWLKYFQCTTVGGMYYVNCESWMVGPMYTGSSVSAKKLLCRVEDKSCYSRWELNKASA